MDKIELEILGLSSSQSQIGSFALVLGEKGGERRLPIIIGGFEAQAIALEIENIKPNRPMTHDLILRIHEAFDIRLEEVLITDLREGVFYALLHLVVNGQVHEIDARPSDAIAIAVRHKAPIYAVPKILEEAGIVIRDEDEDEPLVPEPAYSEEETAEDEELAGTDPEEMTALQRQKLLKKLTKEMEAAIDREDYERAARLRDQISKLED